MKRKHIITACLVGILAPLNLEAQLFALEPDDFADRTVLNTVVPQVRLFTVDSSNWWYLFDVTSATDMQGLAPTGQRVFAHVNIPFWNNDRRLRMDFAEPVSHVSIAFAGGNSFTNEVGRLDVFNSAGLLLDSYVTGLLAGGMAETMSLSRPAGDIAWAVAYVPPGAGSFGRLDHLQVQVVPEPSGLTLLVLAGWTLLARRPRIGETTRDCRSTQ